ncbi:hypothetical protein CHLRE_08g371533v5 [Chlamydomonas reinhardtii]|uniref:Uncharacterized protein n=1 Tax=Chlamydomonas reinhardtii TaxID=3055 RepID=A0A2K3DHA9_CHLRE|nr:uncharacterized protein CHLRE_08g371533v5 [Chlamydomonas reinhardtii]PNW79906.1 hypothetical protein CHLRE_08g371533v5 [Chlamydomonas reinhardtii]
MTSLVKFTEAAKTAEAATANAEAAKADAEAAKKQGWRELAWTREDCSDSILYIEWDTVR